MSWGDWLRPIFEAIAEGLKQLSAIAAGWFARDAKAKEQEKEQLEMELETSTDATRRMADASERRRMRDRLLAKGREHDSK